jgi:hypothetical protein
MSIRLADSWKLFLTAFQAFGWVSKPTQKVVPAFSLNAIQPLIGGSPFGPSPSSYDAA